MVNENFYTFKRAQHKSSYLGNERRPRNAVNDKAFNNPSDTDKSPGATGFNR